MEEPFVFEFPAYLYVDAEYYNHCPEDFDYQIFYAQSRVFSSAQVSLHRQFYNGFSFYTSFLHADVKSRLDLNVNVNVACLTFLFVLKGNVSFSISGSDETINVSKGQCFAQYVPAGMYPSNWEAGESAVVYFMLKPKLMKTLILDYPEFKPAISRLLLADQQPEVYKICTINSSMNKQLVKLRNCRLEKKLELETALLSAITVLFHEYLKQLDPAEEAFKSNKQVAFEARELITLAIEEDHKLSLEVIAAKFYMEPKAFSRLMLKTFGITFQELVKDLKMNHARELLLSGLSVKVVSERLGYSEPAAFSRIFTSYFGYVPSEAKDHDDRMG